MEDRKVSIKQQVRMHDNYHVWEVWCDGIMLSAFYGPMSGSAVVTYARAYRDRKEMPSFEALEWNRDNNVG